MAARRISILDVVMNEREVVEQLDGSGRRYSRSRLAPHGLTCQQAEQRPKSLSSGPRLTVEALVDVAELVPHHAGELIRDFRHAQPGSEPIVEEPAEPVLKLLQHVGTHGFARISPA